jgi:hypothetical protein
MVSGTGGTDTVHMNRSPNIRRFALVPTGPTGDGIRRWAIRPYSSEANCLMSAANASTSSGDVSHEHIQRTSPVCSSQT